MELLRVMNDNNNDTFNFNSIPSFHKKILLPIKFIKNSEEYIILITIADEIFIYKHIIGETFEFIKIKNNLNKICDLECGNMYSIILNNYNELFIYGTFESLFNNLNEFIKLKFNYNEKIKFIRCGFNFIYLITNNNSIYSMGKNNYGQLGLEKEITFRNFFTKINILTNVKDLQCGSAHAILLDNFGNIYGTGYNNWYSLGFAGESTVYGFIKINLTFKVKNISCCNFSTLLINEFNELFGSGKNAFGELGINNKNYRIGFSDEIFIDKKVEKLFKSFDFCNFLLANDNSIYVSGKSDIFEYRRFTKLFTKEKNFIFPIQLFNSFYIFTSNDKTINDNEMKEKKFTNILSKLFNKQLTDISIYLLNDNTKDNKKRKFNYL